MVGWGKNKTHKIIQDRVKKSLAGFQCCRFLSSEEERKREKPKWHVSVIPLVDSVIKISHWRQRKPQLDVSVLL